MAPSKASERLNQVVSLLRPARPKNRPESFTAAVMAGDLEHMQLFLERGANIEGRSVGFASPLAAACSVGTPDAARWLISHGANLDPAGATISPIDAAGSRGNCQMIAVLLDAGLPVEKAAWGATAAATLGNLPALRWLLARGLELDRTYERVGVLREKILREAERNGHAEMVAFVRGEKREFPPPPAGPPVARLPAPREAPPATADERPALIEEAVQLVRAAGHACTAWPSKLPGAYGGELLLSHAARNGATEVVLAMLDAGAKPDFAPAGTPPPLYRAAEAAECDTMRQLLARGASANGADRKSWLPLLGAVRSGEPNVVLILLDAGASPKAKPAGGSTLADSARGPFASEIRAMLEAVPARKPKAKP